MKVTLGKYKNWIGSYQIAEMLLFWMDKYEDDRVHDFGTWLSGGENKDSWLMKLCLWVESKRKRKIKVKIDYWDTWNMDHTLALIILPMLKQLKETKHGHPLIDDEDVPEELRSINASPKENDYDWDDLSEKRWEYVLNEEIFAFNCLVDDSWEDYFRSGQMHNISVPCEWDENGKPILFRWEKGVNDTYKCDYEGMRVVYNRIQNGFCLFGKYFQAHWD